MPSNLRNAAIVATSPEWPWDDTLAYHVIAVAYPQLATLAAPGLIAIPS